MNPHNNNDAREPGFISGFHLAGVSVQRSHYYLICLIYFPALLVLLFSSSLLAQESFAQEVHNLSRPHIVVPDQIAGVTTVVAEQVIKILNSDNPPLLIDARIKADRDYGYIEGSVSLPDVETNCTTLQKLAPDKYQHLMFYCNGIQCGRSVVSIKIARSCGYHKLSWFKGGFSEWQEKGYQYSKN